MVMINVVLLNDNSLKIFCFINIAIILSICYNILGFNFYCDKQLMIMMLEGFNYVKKHLGN